MITDAQSAADEAVTSGPAERVAGAQSSAAAAASARRVARNSLVPFAASVFGRVLAWGLAVVMARTLGPSGAGAYALAVNMWLYAAIVADFGLGTWLTREIAREPRYAREAVRETLGIRLALALAALPLLVGAAALYAAFGADRQIAATTALLGLGLLPGAVSAAGAALFNAHEEMTFPALVQLAGALLTAAAGAAALLSGQGIVALGWVALLVSL